MKKFVFVFLGLILLLQSELSRAQTDPKQYGGFALFPQGSSRVMGMGGAFAAVADDVFAIPFNPAGLSFSEEVFLFGGTQNRVVNREANLAGGLDFSEPYEFLFFAAAYNFKNFSIGVAYVSPFFSQSELFDQKTEFVLQNYEVALSMKINKALSLAVVGIQSESFQSYENSSSALSFSERETNLSYRVGMMLRGKRIGLGFAYEPKKEFDVSTLRNADIGFPYFRDVVVPAKLTFGVSYQANKDLLFVADIDFIEKVSDSVLVGSGLFNAEIEIKPESYTVLHGGLEYRIVGSKYNEVVGRIGAYKEPSRLYNGEDRIHYTLGLEVRLGPVILGVSFDQAKDFTNTAQGFSVSIGHL